MKKLRFIPLVLGILTVFIIAGVIIAYAGMNYHQDGLLFTGKNASYTQGWHLSDGTPVSIPASFPDGDSVELFNMLPDKLVEDGNLCVNTNFTGLSVLVDGRQIYSWDAKDSICLNNKFGLSVYMIHIPASAAGKSIELQFNKYHEGVPIKLFGLLLGNSTANAYTIIKSSFDSIVLSFSLLILAIFLLVCAFIFSRRFTGQSSMGIVNLAVFIIISSVWLLTDNDVMTLISSNLAQLCFICFFSFMLLPVPLVLYVSENCHDRKGLLTAAAVMGVLNMIVCMGLMLFGIYDLSQTLILTHILIILDYALIIILSVTEYKKYRKRSMLDILIGIGLFGAFAVAAIIQYYSGINNSYPRFFRYGVVAFILITGVDSLLRLISQIAQVKSFEELTYEVPSGICRIKSYMDQTILYANEFFYHMFGYQKNEAVTAGFTSADFALLTEDTPKLKDTMARAQSTGEKSFETELRYQNKDGKIIWILSRYRLGRGEGGWLTAVMIDVTAHKQMEEQLRISEEEYRIAINHSDKAIFRYDVSTRTVYAPAGLSIGKASSVIFSDLPDSFIKTGRVHGDSLDDLQNFFKAIHGGTPCGNTVICLFSLTYKEYRWYRFDFTSILDAEGKPLQAIISYFDVTLQRQKELAFQKWQQSYNEMPKEQINYYEFNITDDILECEEGEMLPHLPAGLSGTLESVAEYTAGNRTFFEDKKLLTDFLSRSRLLDLYTRGMRTDKMEFRRIGFKGEPLWTSVSLQLIPDPYSSDIKGYLLLRDIDDKKQAAIALEQRSMLDSLTGLLNRGAFIEQVSAVLNKSSDNEHHALIIIDIDNFKVVNDTLGHIAGDRLLKAIAIKLKNALRSEDICGRLGGDELMIFLRNITQGKSFNSRVASLRDIIRIEEGFDIAVTGCFGAARYPDDGRAFVELYKKADIALYKAKGRGIGSYEIFDAKLCIDTWEFNEVTPIDSTAVPEQDDQ